jgi:hypothetical protein
MRNFYKLYCQLVDDNAFFGALTRLPMAQAWADKIGA